MWWRFYRNCQRRYQIRWKLYQNGAALLWNGPVGRAGCPRGADNFGNGCDAVLCGGIGAFFVEE